MQSIHHVVNSASTLLAAQNILEHDFKEHRYLEVEITAGKHRTLSQNAMIYALYAKAAQRREGETSVTIRRHCKLHFGVPMLRCEDSEFRENWDSCIMNNLTYEQKLEIMDFYPVTSRMNTDQESRYIDDILCEFNLEDQRVEDHKISA